MDASQAAVVTALEIQLHRLRRVADRLAISRGRLGHADDGGGDSIWRGPAHNAWLDAMEFLRRELTETHACVEFAADQSRRALATMAGRG